MTNKLIMTVGLPGSGKSTWARELCDKEPDKWKLVDKDSLRKLLDNGRWSKRNEAFLLKVRDFIVAEALADGFNVIVHDTNFEGKHEDRMLELANQTGAGFEVRYFTESLETCIDRDLKRTDSVGEQVIRKMHAKYLAVPTPSPEYNTSLRDAIIVDLDGTLALFEGKRSPYDAAQCEGDDLNEQVAEVITSWRGYAEGRNVICMSGRQELHRPQTKRWLATNNIKYDHLYMRATDDTRKDSIVKRELYETHVAGKWNVKLVIDDRKQVIEMWRNELGLTCWQVAPGDF